jgi:CheY-like chemotaxis protein
MSTADSVKPILNVADHGPARCLRTRILERAGYGVDEGDSAAHALLRAGGSSLVLLDVKLPDADGFTVCERVKREHPVLPVVITSVDRSAQARREAFSLGADAYLLEPVEPARLLRTVQQFVGRASGVRPAPSAGAWAITDAVGTIEELNPEAAQLFNLSRRGAIGRSLPTYFTENRPTLMGDLLRAAEGTIIDRTTIVQPRDRRPRRVHIDVCLVSDAPGSPIRLRWTFEEVSSETTREAPDGMI